MQVILSLIIALAATPKADAKTRFDVELAVLNGVTP